MSTSAFATYTRQLTLLVTDVANGRWGKVADDVQHALNGQAAAQVRLLVPRTVRRDVGSFFTAGAVRESFEELVTQRSGFTPLSKYWDPACGAGDLLLAATAQLPLSASPAYTLTAWGRSLRGHDLHESFITAARLRLVLAVLNRHRSAGGIDHLHDRRVIGAFPRIEVGDGLKALEKLERNKFRGHVLLNPPYGMAPASPACEWSSGNTSLAATFAAASVVGLARNSLFTAVLPDVLRSGSRYEAWRRHVSSYLEIEEVRPHGLFDRHTDIDVFLLAGRRREPKNSDQVHWWRDSLVAEGVRIEDMFDVRVGAVVDNRDPHAGPKSPYLTARDLPAGGEIGLPERSRCFAGRLISPPFVALRRTSRPGQGAKGGSRGAGVLVLGDHPVAVDNHLIVASPKAGGENRCRELLKVLSDSEIANWLDERIRCRHMTVSVVRALPWHDGNA